jgi:type IV pilus assembly protein PilX
MIGRDDMPRRQAIARKRAVQLHAVPARPGERGVVLVVALLLLLILTIIGIAATRGTSLEERMAGNAQDYKVAFQAAEAGLVDCEDFLDQVTLPPFDGTDGLFKQDVDSTTPLWDSIDWATQSRPYGQTAIPGLAEQPRCIIEELTAVPPPGGSLAADRPAQILMYRLTVRAVGASDNTVVMLQSTYQR